MFDIDQFLDDCREAGSESEPRRAVRDLLDRTLSSPAEVADALRPTEGVLDVLYQSPDLTVLHVVWAPHTVLYPHDHLMWAAIGIYTGQEDNAFYRRSGPGRRTLDESGGRQVGEGEVLLLGDDAIHGVTNPRSALTGAIHIYGGDFVNKPRSQWGPGPREERPYDMDEARRQFIEANEAWRAADSA
jgi:predicted metal-dependent enzyme (double-stranded beta helix superfamily)